MLGLLHPLLVPPVHALPGAQRDLAEAGRGVELFSRRSDVPDGELGADDDARRAAPAGVHGHGERGGAVAGAGELELLHRAAARGAAARVQRVDGTDEEGGRDGRTTTCIVLTAECTIISILFFSKDEALTMTSRPSRPVARRGDGFWS